MLGSVRSRRGWIYVLSAAALVVPAGGIAYLGAVSYRDERGAVSAQNDRQREAALAIASRIERGIADTLDEVERGLATRSAVTAPAARYWFWIDDEQKLRIPHPNPTAIEFGGALDRDEGCAGGRIEDCLRGMGSRTRRAALLRGALRAEAGENWPEAKRQYLAAALDDRDPEVLLGLARVYARLGDSERSAGALAGLERKYADRTFKGVPVALVVAMLRAEATGSDALLELAEAVLAARYALDPVVRLGVVTRIYHALDRARGARPASPTQLRRRAALDDRIAAIRGEARAAAGLADEVAEIVRTATPNWRGRAAAREPARTLAYRRRTGGGVIGIAIDAPMLEAIVAGDSEVVAQNARPLVMAAGSRPDPGLRTIVEVPLGTALPHLSLAVVNPIGDPDPLDEVIRERSQRHVLYTSGLAVLLGIGLLATIRGAVRARELAQLKSDFVSTVSHELKTPLTSIRMFAEMLEHDVAHGDTAKRARYQGVIVQESQRLGLLIANLLDYAQIERGTRRYANSRHAIGQLARDAVTTFETLRDPNHVRNSIEVAVSPEAVIADVDTDRDVVIQSVLNLLHNAAKYGGADRAIQVIVDADPAWATIGVRDHGPGIAAAEHARIFREFYRTPEAYRSGVEGTGLGLALVKQHIEALGGLVAVASVVGAGSTFTVRLPRRRIEEPT